MRRERLFVRCFHAGARRTAVRGSPARGGGTRTERLAPNPADLLPPDRAWKRFFFFWQRSLANSKPCSLRLGTARSAFAPTDLFRFSFFFCLDSEKNDPRFPESRRAAARAVPWRGAGRRLGHPGMLRAAPLGAPGGGPALIA